MTSLFWQCLLRVRGIACMGWVAAVGPREDRFKGSTEFFDCKACASNVVNCNDGAQDGSESGSDNEAAQVVYDPQTAMGKRDAWNRFKGCDV